MSAILAFLLSFLLLYKYLALFLVMFLAAILVPLPTNTLLLAVGAFASQGYFNFAASLFVAVLANAAGDCCGYFLARNYGRKVLRMLRIRLPKYIVRLEDYVAKHPGPTIFLTRFFGAADPLTNLLSGFIGIPFSVFIFYDLLGNIVSIGIVLCVGYFLGTYWQDYSKAFGIIGWAFFGCVCLCIILWRVWHIQQRKRS